MLLFLLGLFIPRATIDDDNIPKREYDELVNMSIASDMPIYGLYINSDTVYHKTINQHVTQAASIFSDMRIEYMSSSSTDLFEDCLSVSPHLFIVLNHGNLQYSFPLPDEPGIILRLFEFLNEKEHPVINSIDELNMRLGSPSFTLISREKDIENAKLLINESVSTTGFIDLLVVTDEIYNEVVNDSDSDFGFFRNEDSVITPIPNNSSSLFDATYPVYLILRKADLKSETPTLIFISNELNESLKQIMYEAGIVESNVSVGWCPPNLQSKLNLRELPRKPIDIVMMTPGLNVQYNLSSIITDEFVAGGIQDIEKWISVSKLIISKYMDETLPAVYTSELEPPLMTPQKLVGTTYESFLNDNETDKFIMYMRASCPHCQKAMSLLGDLQDCFDEHNISDKIKIGFIDISKNSCKEKYPPLIGVPQFSLFLKNGTRHTIFNERTVPEMLRGIARFLPYIEEAGLGLEMPSEAQLTTHVFELIMTARPEDESLQNEIMEYATIEMDLLKAIQQVTEIEEELLNETEINNNSTEPTDKNTNSSHTDGPEEVKELHHESLSDEDREKADLLFKKSFQDIDDMFPEYEVLINEDESSENNDQNPANENNENQENHKMDDL